MPKTPQALRALASERPSSEILLDQCWKALSFPDERNSAAGLSAEVGLILREHFPGNVEVRNRLIERYVSTPNCVAALPLAIFSPDAEVLGYPVEPEAMRNDFGGWALATYLAGVRASSGDFVQLLEAMLTRRRQTSFDAQQIINVAVSHRIGRDQAVRDLMASRLCIGVNPSVSGSFARYLAAEGRLSVDGRESALSLLRALRQDQRLPVVGYDAISDQWRAARATLLDAVSSGIEVV